MANQNIQRLFSIITAEQVHIYLTSKGWQAKTVGNNRLFESVDAAGESQTMSLPSETNSPRFRRSIPNLVFGLSVIEGREAIDIANQIADCEPTTEAIESPAPPIETHVAKSSSSGRAGASTRIILRNRASQIATVATGNGAGHQLRESQALVMNLPASETEVTIEFSGEVDVRSSSGSEQRLSWLLDPAPQAAEHSAWLLEPLQLAIESELTTSEDLVSQWSTSIERFLFSFSSLGQASIDSHRWQLASAILLSEAAQSLPDTFEAKRSLYLLMARLCAIGNQQLAVSALGETQLWQVARADSVVSPHQTRQWLRQATRTD